MSEQLSAILLTSLIILVIILAWGATVAFVHRDTARRRLAGWQRFLWFVGAALFPVVGFVAYLITRYLAVPVPQPPPAVEGHSRKWGTRLKPAPPGGPKRLPTVPAADYVRAAEREARQPGPGRAGAEFGYVLAVSEGPHRGQEFVIDQLPAHIGRGPGCPIRLDNDRGVSRQHAELYHQAGGLRLRDLGSTHGTMVNGHPVKDKGLRPGDKIRVGHSLLTVKTSR